MVSPCSFYFSRSCSVPESQHLVLDLIKLAYGPVYHRYIKITSKGISPSRSTDLFRLSWPKRLTPGL